MRIDGKKLDKLIDEAMGGRWIGLEPDTQPTNKRGDRDIKTDGAKLDKLIDEAMNGRWIGLGRSAQPTKLWVPEKIRIRIS